MRLSSAFLTALGSAALGLVADSLAQPVATFQNEPTGFRDIEWDTPLSQFATVMQRTNDGVGADFYLRKDDPLTLGGVKLYSLSYAYQKQRFVGVVFRTEGAGNEAAIVDYLRGEYGPGKRSGTAGAFKIEWSGKTARVELHCQSRTLCIGIIGSAKAYAEYVAAEAKKPVEQRPPDRIPGS